MHKLVFSHYVLPVNAANSVNQDIFECPAATIRLLLRSELQENGSLHLERKVERAFFEAGKALAELRDRRLYRSSHRTFKDYCRDRFGHSRQKSNY